MTNPNPLAPPVTTPTFPCNEKVASVGKTFAPARPAPATGFEEGSCESGGYSTVMESSVRAYEPAAAAMSCSVCFFCSAVVCVLLLLLCCAQTAGAEWNPAVARSGSRVRSRAGVVDAGLPKIRAVEVRCAALRRTRAAD